LHIVDLHWTDLIVDDGGEATLLIHEGVAVKFMKRERLLSLGAFTSIFSSYVITDYVQEAILTFKVMEQYNIPLDLALLKKKKKKKNNNDFFFFFFATENT
jgi:hypothetical protein